MLSLIMLSSLIILQYHAYHHKILLAFNNGKVQLTFMHLLCNFLIDFFRNYYLHRQSRREVFFRLNNSYYARKLRGKLGRSAKYIGKEGKQAALYQPSQQNFSCRQELSVLQIEAKTLTSKTMKSNMLHERRLHIFI